MGKFLTIEQTFDSMEKVEGAAESSLRRLSALDSRGVRVQQQGRRDSELIEGLQGLHAELCSRQRTILRIIAELDERRLWRDDGCRDMAQWLSGQLGISAWIAGRWVTASHAIPTLPLISQALESGRLCLDKVVELCRFATPETEQELIAWARRVSVAAVKHKADVFNRPEIDEVRSAERARFLR